MTQREEKFAMNTTAEGLQHFCDLPEGSGAVDSMHVLGNGLVAITDEHKLFMISPEGAVADVTDKEFKRLT
jgi:hypothetical protein